MGKILAIAIYMVFITSNCQSQDNYSTNRKVDEKYIIPPKYVFGYSAASDSLFKLIKDFKIQPDTLFTYVASFTIKFDKNGKILNQDYSVYLPQMSDVFKKLADKLPMWVKNIDNWSPAYNKRTKKRIPNFKLYFHVDLSRKIWISINDGYGLHDLFKKEYPIR